MRATSNRSGRSRPFTARLSRPVRRCARFSTRARASGALRQNQKSWRFCWGLFAGFCREWLGIAATGIHFNSRRLRPGHNTRGDLQRAGERVRPTDEHPRAAGERVRLTGEDARGSAREARRFAGRARARNERAPTRAGLALTPGRARPSGGRPCPAAWPSPPDRRLGAPDRSLSAPGRTTGRARPPVVRARPNRGLALPLLAAPRPSPPRLRATVGLL